MISGSCLCGEVQYTVEGKFDHFFLCHCRHCQKDTGSAHAANLFSHGGQLTWSQGEALVIPNPRCALFSADGIESMLHLLEASGHGVLPGVKELYRPVLLIDYLLLDEKQASRLKEETSQFIMPDSDDYINDLLKI